MASSKRLQVVARLAELREQQQLFRLRSSQAEYDKQNAALKQLYDYQQEYYQAEGVADDASALLAVEQLQNRSRFLSDLNRASELQHAEVQRGQREVESEKQQWQQLHRRRESLQRLADEALSEETRESERRSEREADELWLVNQFGRRDG